MAPYCLDDTALVSANVCAMFAACMGDLQCTWIIGMIGGPVPERCVGRLIRAITVPARDVVRGHQVHQQAPAAAQRCVAAEAGQAEAGFAVPELAWAQAKDVTRSTAAVPCRPQAEIRL